METVIDGTLIQHKYLFSRPTRIAFKLYIYISTGPNFLLQLTEKLYTILCCPALRPSVCVVGSSCSFQRKHTILFMKTTPWRGVSVDPSPVSHLLDLEVHSCANLASISKLLRICMSSTRTTEYTCNASVYVWRMN
jgi:hypothetical protein